MRQQTSNFLKKQNLQNLKCENKNLVKLSLNTLQLCYCKKWEGRRKVRKRERKKKKQRCQFWRRRRRECWVSPLQGSSGEKKKSQEDREKDKELCGVVGSEVPNRWWEGLSVRLCDVVASVACCVWCHTCRHLFMCECNSGAQQQRQQLLVSTATPLY